MKPGPSRLPTKILELRQSRHRKRPQEPQAPPLHPRAPVWLDAEGKKLWRAGMRRFENVGILTRLDREAFARYCQTLAVWRKMEAFRQQHGEVHPLRNRHGDVTGFILFPQMKLYVKLLDQIGKMESQFGLTPASRASLVKQQDTPAHGNSDTEKKLRFFTDAG
jgi:P27 family predicted phage terminase small subunit